MTSAITSASETLAFSPGTFSADEGCRWEPASASGVRMNAHYIAGPRKGEERVAWLRAVHQYRDTVRTGAEPRAITMDYQGVRAWMRMAMPLAKRLDVQPGESVRTIVEVQWVSGNSELCVAFDRHRRGDDGKANWTGVRRLASGVWPM
jgi:hypothetical protein